MSDCKTFKCRLCYSVNITDVIELPGFPKAAQYFVANTNQIGEDYPISLCIAQCNMCGLVQLKNEPVAYYRDVITAAALSLESKSNLAKEWKPFIEKYLLTGKSALEVGSGRGDFLEVLDSLGVKASGIENSEQNIEESIAKSLNVSKGYLLDNPSKVFDRYSLVVCNNFLEHQPDLKGFIRALHNLLHQEGYLYVSVPNLEYLLKKSCLYEFVADHLVYFTEKTLKLAFEMNGFEILDFYNKNNGNDLVLIVTPVKVIDLNLSKDSVDRVIKSVKNVVKYGHELNKKITVWGAGHRAIALMALADIHEIQYVVDSATFKQGKYTPILHKKIISPKEFLETDCDLLIVMLPGNYGQQVQEFLMHHGVTVETLIFEDEEIV